MIYSISLYCRDCDYIECPICPLSTYIPIGSKKGCIRQVPEELYITYFNNINELLPFIHNYSNSSILYNKILEDNYKVYNSPLAGIITKSGKIINPTSQYAI